MAKTEKDHVNIAKSLDILKVNVGIRKTKKPTKRKKEIEEETEIVANKQMYLKKATDGLIAEQEVRPQAQMMKNNTTLDLLS